MVVRELLIKEKNKYNSVVSHPLQSWEWGEFRQKTGVKVVRRGLFDKQKLVGGFQVTIHPLPHLPFTIGYLPKGGVPDETLFTELTKIGKENRCIFVKLEPNVEKQREKSKEKNTREKFKKFDLRESSHPLFTKYTFQLDLTKTEEELLAQMHPKTRYNIRLAQKKGVKVEEDNSHEAFNEYLRLTFATTKRQGFFAHDEKYHRCMWETLQDSGMAHLLTAKYQGKILVTWIVFLFNDILYYPYGASSDEHREVMASNLMLWEAMRWGQAHGAKLFDLWGSLGLEADPKDAWYGFHRFKQGYNPRLVEFVGSYDLILDPLLYNLYTFANQLRWLLLKIKA